MRPPKQLNLVGAARPGYNPAVPDGPPTESTAPKPEPPRVNPIAAKLMGIVQTFIPRSLLLAWWKRRNLIFSIIIMVIGVTWMICGVFFEEPGSVLVGFGLVAFIPLWGAYKFGAVLQLRRPAARAAQAPPPELEDDEDEDVPPPPPRPNA